MSFEKRTEGRETEQEALKNDEVFDSIKSWYSNPKYREKTAEEVLKVAIKILRKNQASELIDKLERNKAWSLEQIASIGFKTESQKRSSRKLRVFKAPSMPTETEQEALKKHEVFDSIKAWYARPKYREKTAEQILKALLKGYQRKGVNNIVAALQKNKNWVLKYIISVGFKSESQQKRERVSAIRKLQQKAEKQIKTFLQESDKNNFDNVEQFLAACLNDLESIRKEVPDSERSTFDKSLKTLIKKLYQHKEKTEKASLKKLQTQAEKSLTTFISKLEDKIKNDPKAFAKACLDHLKKITDQVPDSQSEAFDAFVLTLIMKLQGKTEKQEEVKTQIELKQKEQVLDKIMDKLDAKDQKLLKHRGEPNKIEGQLKLSNRIDRLLKSITNPEVRSEIEAKADKAQTAFLEEARAFYRVSVMELQDGIAAFKPKNWNTFSEDTDWNAYLEEAFAQSIKGYGSPVPLAISKSLEKRSQTLALLWQKQASKTPESAMKDTDISGQVAQTIKGKNKSQTANKSLSSQNQTESEVAEVEVSPEVLNASELLLKKYGVGKKMLEGSLSKAQLSQGVQAFNQMVGQDRMLKKIMVEKGGATYLAPAFVASLAKHKNLGGVMEAVKKLPEIKNEQQYLSMIKKILASDAGSGLGYVFHETKAVEARFRSGLSTQLSWDSESVKSFLGGERKKSSDERAEERSGEEEGFENLSIEESVKDKNPSANGIEEVKLSNEDIQAKEALAMVEDEEEQTAELQDLKTKDNYAFERKTASGERFKVLVQTRVEEIVQIAA